VSKPKLVRQSKVNFNAKEAKAIRKAMQRKFSFCDLGANFAAFAFQWPFQLLAQKLVF